MGPRDKAAALRNKADQSRALAALIDEELRDHVGPRWEPLLGLAAEVAKDVVTLASGLVHDLDRHKRRR